MTTKIVALGMIHYPSEHHFLTLPLLLLDGRSDVEIISFEADKVNMYDKLINNSDDAYEKVDEVFHKYLDAVDQADVLLLINPTPDTLEVNNIPEEMAREFTVWMAYLAGYAYSQGVLTVYYAGEDETVAHPFIKRQTHAILNNVGELLNYDFKALSPNNRAKVMLPTLISGGL